MVLLTSGCAVAQYELGGGTCGRIALKREVAGCWHGVFGYVDVTNLSTYYNVLRVGLVSVVM